MGSYEFLIKPSEDLLCLKCRKVAVNPWQHGKCGRLFCKVCLDRDGGEDMPCPECNTTGYFEDNRSK
jgi:hypothetical protein